MEEAISMSNIEVAFSCREQKEEKLNTKIALIL